MKNLKTLCLAILCSTSTMVIAQTDHSTIEVSVNSLAVTVDTIDEIETVNWDELFEVFESNAESDQITVQLAIKDLDMNSKTTSKIKLNNSSISVTGLKQNEKALIGEMKKRTKRFKKMLRSIKNK